MQAAINKAINPFNVWADLVRGLSDRLTAQMDADGLLVGSRRPTPSKSRTTCAD